MLAFILEGEAVRDTKTIVDVKEAVAAGKTVWGDLGAKDEEGIDALLDRLVDDYVPLTDASDAGIAALEAEVIDVAGTPAGAACLARIFALKHALQTLRRTAIHQREILLRLSRAEFPQIPLEAMPF